MSEPTKRSHFTILLLTVPLAFFDAWGCWEYLSAQEGLAASSDQASVCESLAQSIEALRHVPVKVEESAQNADALAKLIETSAQQIGLGTDRIVHVTPADPRRLGDSPYLEQPTTVEVREVTLRQLIESSLAIERSAPRLKCAMLTLRTPPGDPNPINDLELWNVQFTLTAHIYAPKIPIR